jgi:ribonuclease HI
VTRPGRDGIPLDGGPDHRRVHVDAVVDNDGLSAISVVLAGRDARPIVSRVIVATGSVEAEMRAVLLALQVCAKARWDDVTVWCDALGVVRMCQGGAECRPDDLRPLRDEARERLAEHPGWSVEWCKRTYNSAAHAMAGQIMRSYKHGREHGRQDRKFQERRSEWQGEVDGGEDVPGARERDDAVGL